MSRAILKHMRYFISLLILSLLVSCQEESASTSSKSAKVAQPQKPKTAYTDVLQHRLLTLSKGSLVTLTGFEEPTKYYLFYKTASWCPPCRKFTPFLVNFYNEYKMKYGNQFEIILLTGDQSYDDMERYANSKQMGWPHLAPEFVTEFNTLFRFPGTGIPNLILTDIQGKVLKTSYGPAGQYYGPAAPMQELQRLLDNQ